MSGRQDRSAPVVRTAVPLGASSGRPDRCAPVVPSSGRPDRCAPVVRTASTGIRLDRGRNRYRPGYVSSHMIRTATPADLDAVAALHAEARATYYRGHIPDDAFDSPAEHARTRAGWESAIGRAAVLCAIRHGTVAGVAAFGEREGAMTLTQLHVAPGYWRSGVGSELHTAVVEAWQRAGVTTARLEVFEKNTRARAFYSHHGWYPDPEEPLVGNHLILRLTVSRAA
ncbi:GNAT family N-acetyltransferase [Streptomyces sp. NPDC048389]|uniref:GNAT family N-acetyltransferase n=1 Tax=Streptomyces sp. NPDC048389 TaxID=3154622 RepID=UPI003452A07F